MLQLDKLTPLLKKRKRVGRGGSRGGTSGKGNKGQKARSGPKIDPGFEGGQMPLYRRLPKRGFNNTQFRSEIHVINVDQLNNLFQANDVITKELLIEKRIIKPSKGERNFVLKVLGRGELAKKLSIHADSCSGAARQAIENAGGEVTLIGEIR